MIGIGWMMKKNILLIENYLDYLYKEPICELTYTKDYEFLIKVMLSARTTDKKVNEIGSVLFEKYKTLESLKNANLVDIKEIIKPLGSYNKKSLYIINISKSLLNEYNGIVPNSHESLEKMSGIGRKTANVVLGELYNKETFAVDTHVIRVSNRLNLVNSKDPRIIEEELKKIFKKENWNKLHKQMVLFGRYKCSSRNPKCLDCKLKKICKRGKNEYKYN